MPGVGGMTERDGRHAASTYDADMTQDIQALIRLPGADIAHAVAAIRALRASAGVSA